MALQTDEKGNKRQKMNERLTQRRMKYHNRARFESAAFDIAIQVE